MRLLNFIFAAILGCVPFAALATPISPQDYLHLNWMDNSVNPSKNFYEYANGTWKKNHPIPDAYPSWNIFLALHERNQQLIKDLVEKAAAVKQPNAIEQKVGDFYYSGMDVASINELGAKPLQAEFDRINQLTDKSQLQDEITHLQHIGVDAPFAFGSMQDFKNSTQEIGVAEQSGLSLPDRDYYLKNTKHFKMIRAAFTAHMTKMFMLLGDKKADAVKEAQIVLSMETTFAQGSMSRVERRNPYAIYHIKNVKQLDNITQHFDWQKYFAAIHHPEIKAINLTTPGFFKVMNFELFKMPLDDWKVYLRWHLVNSYAAFLSKPFEEENFKMVQLLTGTKELLPRWKRVINAESGGLGFAIGKMYVENYFPVEAKEKAEQMITNIRTVLKNDIQQLSWMSPKTKQAALEKLAKMKNRVGYPTKWWDYSSLKIDRGPYVLNLMRVTEFLEDRDLNKIGKPVDREEWDMTPQTINAYYDPSMNCLNIPAGILQPPFFDANAPDAINYGGIGFVIGHEMTHGFDDEGSQFDAQGNLRNWWTKQDLKRFRQNTQHIVKQFSNYKIAGSHVQGNLVVGEATADLGGLKLAYTAFHEYAFKNAATINGFTPDQQFFLNAAHVWASNMRPAEKRRLVITDPHPPAKFRVNGTLQNIPEFNVAFHIPAEKTLFHSQKVSVW